MTVLAQHSTATAEHGSPLELVNLARAVMGGIDLDPASSPAWNQQVGAESILTERDDALKMPWIPGGPPPTAIGPLVTPWEYRSHRCRVFLNPPGDRKGTLVAGFWRALAAYFHSRWVTSAIWIGFSLEQLSRLQRVGAITHPLEHSTLIPKQRIAYQSSPGVIGSQPTHASYITLLSHDAGEQERFAALGAEMGYVV